MLDEASLNQKVRKEKGLIREMKFLHSYILKTTSLILLPTLYLTCCMDVSKVTLFIC